MKKLIIFVSILMILLIPGCTNSSQSSELPQRMTDTACVKLYNHGNGTQIGMYLDEAGYLWGQGAKLIADFGISVQNDIDLEQSGIVGYSPVVPIASNVSAVDNGTTYLILCRDGRLYINDYMYHTGLIDNPYEKDPLWLADTDLAAAQPEVIKGCPLALEDVAQISQGNSSSMQMILLENGTLLSLRNTPDDPQDQYDGLLGRKFSVVATQVTSFGIGYYIKSDGSMWVNSAYNGYGIRGDGTYDELSYREAVELKLVGNTPVYTKVMEHVRDGLVNTRSYVPFGYTGMALTENGELLTWGNNEYGQCGTGSSGDGYAETRDLVLTPTKIMDNIRSIYAGAECCFALSKDGKLYGWGNANRGYLGNGICNPNANYAGLGVVISDPILILEDVREFRSYMLVFSAIKTDGSLWVWGNDFHGQCGDGGSAAPQAHRSAGATLLITPQPTPTRILDRVLSISEGGMGQSLLALTEDGTLYGWGENPFFAVVNGSTDLAVLNIPTAAPNMSFTIENGKYVFAVLADE